MEQTEGFGFPQSSTFPPVAPPQQTIARPTPLPKRPKGRWFIGLILLGSCGFGAWQAYDSFLRYRAYGVVTGRILQLSSPWIGEVTAFHVREGDVVRQGQSLLTMESTQMRQRLSALSDELVSAQADLEAEAAKLKWQAAFHIDQSKSGKAAITKCGDSISPNRRIWRRSVPSSKSISAFTTSAIAPFEVERIRLDYAGQWQKLEKMKTALDESKAYADVSGILLAKLGDISDSLAEDGQDQLKPKLAKIEALKAERTRLEQYLAKGRLLAPSNGLVVKLHHFAGEHAGPTDTLVSFLEEGSLQVVLYVGQGTSASFTPGHELDMVLDPYPDRFKGTITRLGDQLEAAPEQIKRHYSSGQRLLPIHVQPSPETRRWMALRVESVVKLP